MTNSPGPSWPPPGAMAPALPHSPTPTGGRSAGAVVGRVAIALVAIALLAPAGLSAVRALTGDDAVPSDQVVSIDEAERTGLRVGDVVEIAAGYDLVTTAAAESPAFDDLGGGQYRATRAGTFELVTYEFKPCGGPPEASPHYTVTVVDGADAPSPPAGFGSARHAPATSPAPGCG